MGLRGSRYCRRDTLAGVRIALVSDCYPPRVGGIEVQVAGLAAALRRAGHQTLVVTATPGPPSADVLRLAAPVPLGAPVNPGAGPHLRRVLADADVVHAHLGVLGPFAQQAAAVANGLGLPTLLTWHSLPGASPLALALAPTWRRLVEAGARPSAVSSLAASQLSTLLRRRSVPVLPNGLDVAAWSALAAPTRRTRTAAGDPVSAATATGPPRVVSVMRFSARKRPAHLVALMSRVRGLSPAARRPRLTIVGDGPWWPALATMVRNSRLREWVELPGRLPPAGVAERLRGADLYVAPSRREAFGIAALEARCAGVPVAGYTGSGVRDVVQPGVGGLLETGDRALAAAVAELLADPDRLQRYAEHHRSNPPRRHDWSAVTATTLRHYEQAYRGHGRDHAGVEATDARTSRGL